MLELRTLSKDRVWTGAKSEVLRWPCILASALILLMGSGTNTKVEANTRLIEHLLTVELQLQSQKIRVQDTVTFRTLPGEKSIEFFLAPGAQHLLVQENGTPVKYEFRRGGVLCIIFDSPFEAKPQSMQISYEAVFADPIPATPISFDNPGFGVTGTITPEGVFLLSGCGWYPQIPGEIARFKIKIIAPKGIYAITAGHLITHEDKGDRTVSRWEVHQPVEGLSLSAGRYVIHSQNVGKTTVSTYFFPETDSLSETYLKAASRHIEFYENLIGPYPFPKFAVVENFFPTGYGFPSYTLLGSTVLRLPFIPETSLKHEVAHSWWGNGVFVDSNSGNWCEGLTTYVSDYLSKEMTSSAEGREYRRQILQNYATLANTGEDLPLARFMSRENPASQAVGYGKAAFVFHMVRQKIGDTLFWQSLRRIFKERLFIKTSWSDFRDVFIQEGNWNTQDAHRFFDQWLTRTGAPVLELERVQAERGTTQWNIKGFLKQEPPRYALDVPVRLQMKTDYREKTLSMEGLSSSFLFQINNPPLRLMVDPEIQVFRLLYPDEIPATVNSLKGSANLMVVVSDDAPEELKEMFQDLLISLNHENTPLLREEDVDLQKTKANDVLLLGYPSSKTFRDLFSHPPEGLVLESSSFLFKDAFSSAQADTLFLVYKDASREGKLTALFYSVSKSGAEALKKASLKITHYGNFSYLSFFDGMNRQKGTWPVSHSPLIVDFKEAQ